MYKVISQGTVSMETGQTDPPSRLTQAVAQNIDKKFQRILNEKLLTACNKLRAVVDLEQVQTLLSAGADINTRDREGWTCLMHVTRKNTNKYHHKKKNNF